MYLLDYQTIHFSECCTRLKRTQLIGYERELVYRDARISLKCDVDPRDIFPTQRYTLKPLMLRTATLYQSLLWKGIDIMEMTGALWLKVREDDGVVKEFHLTPPIVEFAQNPDTGADIYLLADGMHRTALAIEQGYPINIILVDGVSQPYYAYPLKGWSEVQVFENLPTGFVKKHYRNPDNHKLLFRNYDIGFPNIQPKR